MDDDDFLSPGQLEAFKKVGELEEAKQKEKDRLSKAKDQAADRMGGMVSLAMDALQMALMSEDEAVRMKAVGMVLDRLVPRVKAVGGAEEEVVEVPESRKNLLADVEEQIKKMKQS